MQSRRVTVWNQEAMAWNYHSWGIARAMNVRCMLTEVVCLVAAIGPSVGGVAGPSAAIRCIRLGYISSVQEGITEYVYAFRSIHCACSNCATTNKSVKWEFQTTTSYFFISLEKAKIPRQGSWNVKINHLPMLETPTTTTARTAPYQMLWSFIFVVITAPQLSLRFKAASSTSEYAGLANPPNSLTWARRLWIKDTIVLCPVRLPSNLGKYVTVLYNLTSLAFRWEKWRSRVSAFEVEVSLAGLKRGVSVCMYIAPLR